MGRPLRAAVGGLIYHVLNRANARATLFAKPDDYHAFVGVLAEAQTIQPISLLAYCVMPNHWHLVLKPERDRELSRFVGWVDSDAHATLACVPRHGRLGTPVLGALQGVSRRSG